MSPFGGADNGVEHCSCREISTCCLSSCSDVGIETQRDRAHEDAVSGPIVAVEENEIILGVGGGVQVCEDAGFAVKDLVRVTTGWSFDC